MRAGVFYYEQILSRCAAGKRPLRLVLNHADVDTVLACVAGGDRAELGQYLGTTANELFDAGADLVAVTAVAPHLAIAEIAQVARGPLVDVLGLIPVGLAAAKIERVAIFGNRVVMQTDAFGSLPAHMVIRPKPSVIDAVDTIYNDIALTGKWETPAEVALLDDIARDLIGRGGARAILLAGTDFSSFYAERSPSFPYAASCISTRYSDVRSLERWSTADVSAPAQSLADVCTILSMVAPPARPVPLRKLHVAAVQAEAARPDDPNAFVQRCAGSSPERRSFLSVEVQVQVLRFSGARL